MGPEQATRGAQPQAGGHSPLVDTQFSPVTVGTCTSSVVTGAEHLLVCVLASDQGPGCHPSPCPLVFLGPSRGQWSRVLLAALGLGCRLPWAPGGMLSHGPGLHLPPSGDNQNFPQPCPVSGPGTESPE